MISPDPQAWTLRSLSKALRRKEVSPVEITRAYLDRIEAYDPQINSFITVLPRRAMRAAHQAEKEILNGTYRGTLHGIPFAAKDLFLTRGIRTTCGSKILAEFVPTYDAAVIERLSSAGAILLGKLNMHEFAYGTTSVNLHFGPVRNPWDRERIAGGSSGGSAAALACSLAPLTLGTDTGGSIRIPSALCGTPGLKPTYGRISRYGVHPLCWSLDHVGPMAKSVSDIALAMGVLAGYDPRDPASSPASVPDYTKFLAKDLKGIRLGIPEFFFSRLEGEVSRVVQSALNDLRRIGARVRPFSIPGLHEASAAAYVTLLAEGAAVLEKWRLSRPGDLDKGVKARLELGAMIKATDYLRAQRIRARARSAFGEAFRRVDAIVTPQLPITAPKIGQASVTVGGKSMAVPAALTRFTRIFNLIGFPSLSLPCGFSQSGMPVALQVAGKPFGEGMVLRIGHAYEINVPWKDRHPNL